MKKLKIVQCNDSLRWYSNLIGKLVPYMGDTGTEYKSKEPTGYINFVQYEDAILIKKEINIMTTPFLKIKLYVHSLIADKNFVGWNKNSIRGYQTATVSIYEKIKEIEKENKNESSDQSDKLIRLKKIIDKELKNLPLGNENKIMEFFNETILKNYSFSAEEKLLGSFYLSAVFEGSFRGLKYANKELDSINKKL